MVWDNLMSTANQVEAKTHIQSNTHLDQQCLGRKRLLRMKDSGQDEQEVQPKNDAI